MMRQKKRNNTEKKWSKAEVVAHSKNKREAKLLDLTIGELAKNQYLTRMRYRQDVSDMRESVWPIRSSTGYVEDLVWVQKDSGAATNSSDNQNGLRGRQLNHRFVHAVETVIKRFRSKKYNGQSKADDPPDLPDEKENVLTKAFKELEENTEVEGDSDDGDPEGTSSSGLHPVPCSGLAIVDTKIIEMPRIYELEKQKQANLNKNKPLGFQTQMSFNPSESLSSFASNVESLDLNETLDVVRKIDVVTPGIMKKKSVKTQEKRVHFQDENRTGDQRPDPREPSQSSESSTERGIVHHLVSASPHQVRAKQSEYLQGDRPLSSAGLSKQTNRTPTRETLHYAPTQSKSTPFTFPAAYQEYAVEFASLSIQAQSASGRSKQIIGRGPLKLPKCLEYKEDLMRLVNQSFTVALAKKKITAMAEDLAATNIKGKTKLDTEVLEPTRPKLKDRKSVRRTQSAIPLSRYVRAIESGMQTDHIYPSFRSFHVPISKGMARRERQKMMKEAQRPRTSSDLERRRMTVIQDKIRTFIDSLPAEQTYDDVEDVGLRTL